MYKIVDLFGKPVPGVATFRRFKSATLNIYEQFANSFTNDPSLISGCFTQEDAIKRATKDYNKPRSKTRENSLKEPTHWPLTMKTKL